MLVFVSTLLLRPSPSRSSSIGLQMRSPSKSAGTSESSNGLERQSPSSKSAKPSSSSSRSSIKPRRGSASPGKSFGRPSRSVSSKTPIWTTNASLNRLLLAKMVKLVKSINSVGVPQIVPLSAPKKRPSGKPGSISKVESLMVSSGSRATISELFNRYNGPSDML